jgi:hypothetical protein
MKNINGLWNNYRQGEVYGTLDAIINGLVKKGYRLRLDSIDLEKKITGGEELFRTLRDYEEKKGLEKLLELFYRGLKLEAVKGEGIKVDIEIYLRMPEESEDRRNLFKEMIANWFVNQEISFSEKFFKQSQVKFLPHRLERVLKRSFGFQINYKILMVFKKNG